MSEKPLSSQLDSSSSNSPQSSESSHQQSQETKLQTLEEFQDQIDFDPFFYQSQMHKEENKVSPRNQDNFNTQKSQKILVKDQNQKILLDLKKLKSSEDVNPKSSQKPSSSVKHQSNKVQEIKIACQQIETTENENNENNEHLEEKSHNVIQHQDDQNSQQKPSKITQLIIKTKNRLHNAFLGETPQKLQITDNLQKKRRSIIQDLDKNYNIIKEITQTENNLKPLIINSTSNTKIQPKNQRRNTFAMVREEQIPAFKSSDSSTNIKIQSRRPSVNFQRFISNSDSINQFKMQNTLKANNMVDYGKAWNNFHQKYLLENFVQKAGGNLENIEKEIIEDQQKEFEKNEGDVEINMDERYLKAKRYFKDVIYGRISRHHFQSETS